jgi:hypothetical protein
MRARLAASVLLAAALGACGRPDPVTPQAIAAAAREAGTVNGLCPMMRRLVDPAYVLEWQGVRIGVCCATCLVALREEPGRWLEVLRRDPKAYGLAE